MLLCQRSMTRLLAEGTKYVVSKSIIVYTCKKIGLFTNFLRHGSRTSQPEPNFDWTTALHRCSYDSSRKTGNHNTFIQHASAHRIVAFGLLGQLQIFLPWPDQGKQIAVLIRKNDGKTRITIAMSMSSYVFLLGTSIRFSMIACSCEGFVLRSVFVVILIYSRTLSKLMECTWSKLEGARHTTSQNRLENQENTKQNENISELNPFHHWAFIERLPPPTPYSVLVLQRLGETSKWNNHPAERSSLTCLKCQAAPLSWNIHCPNVDVFCLNPPFLSLQICYSKNQQQKRLSPWLPVQKSTPPPNIHKI